MLMVTGMPVALVGAQAAEVGAGLQHLHHQRRGGGGPPRQDRTGGGAGVGAIEIEADAAGELRRAVLGEAGIGARHADLSAIEAGFNALGEGIIDDAGCLGMAGQHLAHAHAALSCGEYRRNARHRRLVTPALRGYADQGFQRRKLAIRRRPVAWLFSGWNWVPKILSRPTTAVIGPP